jgi:hypothetical protein
VLEAELRSLQRRLARRDNEILKQERELHKLRVRQMSNFYGGCLIRTVSFENYSKVTVQ